MTALYTITHFTTNGSNFNAEIHFNPDHPVFAGHFPGHPVVPGVILVEIATAATSQFTGEKLILTEAANMKFLKMIDPVDNPVVLIDGSVSGLEEIRYKADIKFFSGGIDYARLRGIRLATLK